jgi:hypothetical protein
VVIPPFTIRLDINLSSNSSELAFNGTSEQHGVVAGHILDTAALLNHRCRPLNSHHFPDCERLSGEAMAKSDGLNGRHRVSFARIGLLRKPHTARLNLPRQL